MKENNTIISKPVPYAANIKIDHLKCSGCATSIEMDLLTISGITKVHVTEETDELEIFHDEDLDNTIVKNKLKQMGYPLIVQRMVYRK